MSEFRPATDAEIYEHHRNYMERVVENKMQDMSFVPDLKEQLRRCRVALGSAEDLLLAIERSFYGHEG